MKVLITGGAGFIGSNIATLLLSEEIEVIVIDNLSTGKRENIPAGASFYQRDIVYDDLSDIFTKHVPDILIHTAAQVSVQVSLSDPFFDAKENILGSIRILEMCRKYVVKKFIYSSSSAVYGDIGTQSADENFPPNPPNFYGVSKFVTEYYIRSYSSLFHIPYVILRYSNVYGPNQDETTEGGGVISIFANHFAKGTRPIIYGNGETKRDFIFVKDVAAANLAALHFSGSDVFNISSNTSTSLIELINRLNKISKKQIEPIYLPKRKGDLPFSCLLNEKAKKLLNWKPSFSLDEGLLITYLSKEGGKT
ncbi:NAD-dependent epimerase/dehydratase family protein [Microaerobacter geothermalis]|uniref:NAD-dependent epimerase/dehydratase family protein n=1 Tax=Microaerobacter geothermalis TaxID=674972 RepID=UPI001F2A218C|nr:NAD-dependent epimerase/dehydratase family protein [Microaerobacter geothermalis]MCF6093317.1 NAD-dependent epimerase/dehydratase family protein [Microaerobacter geothermalis]